jgi:hypothetical protein
MAKIGAAKLAAAAAARSAAASPAAAAAAAASDTVAVASSLGEWRLPTPPPSSPSTEDTDGVPEDKESKPAAVDTKQSSLGGSVGGGGDGDGDNGMEPEPDSYPVFQTFKDFSHDFRPDPSMSQKQLKEERWQHKVYEAFRYIQYLYGHGVFQCPGAMKDLETRRPGIPWDRSKRRDSRFQSVRSKRAPANTAQVLYDDDSDAPPPDVEDDYGAITVQQQQVRRDIVAVHCTEYAFSIEAPFQYERLVGASNMSWMLSVNYIEDVMTLIFVLTRNPPAYKMNPWALHADVRLPLLRNTSALIYFAIATQTGPLFETGKSIHEGHVSIGVAKGRSQGYTNHELSVATQLFLALGAKPSHVEEMLLQEHPGPGKTTSAQRSFNQGGKKITFPKTMALKLLGMSGKPAWDGRLPKYTRPNSDGGSGTRKRKRTSTTYNHTTQAQASRMKPPPKEQLNPMEDNQKDAPKQEDCIAMDV